MIENNNIINGKKRILKKIEKNKEGKKEYIELTKKEKIYYEVIKNKEYKKIRYLLKENKKDSVYFEKDYKNIKEIELNKLNKIFNHIIIYNPNKDIINNLKNTILYDYIILKDKRKNKIKILPTKKSIIYSDKIKLKFNDKLYLNSKEKYKGIPKI